MNKLRFFIGLTLTIVFTVFLFMFGVEELGGYVFLFIAIILMLIPYTIFYWKNIKEESSHNYSVKGSDIELYSPDTTLPSDIEAPTPPSFNTSENTPSSESIYCSKCGNKLPADSNFCNKCGAKTPSAIDANTSPEQQPVQSEGSPVKESKGLRPVITFLLVLVGISAIPAIYFLLILPKNNYANAENFFANGNYSSAYEIYAELDNYKDSSEKAKECLYMQATTLRNARKWDDANLLFEQIKDYKDSSTLIHYHAYEETASQEATCETDGYKDYVCSDCGETLHSIYKSSGHIYAPATCTEPQTCKVCGVTRGTAIGHAQGSATCSRCNQIIFETITLSGRGSDVKSISLPSGTFRITCKMTSGNSNLTINLNYGKVDTIDDLIFNDYVAGAVEVTTISGPIENGSFVINANSWWDNSKLGWKITIEAIG